MKNLDWFYCRLNNPDLEILENSCAWGMAPKIANVPESRNVSHQHGSLRVLNPWHFIVQHARLWRHRPFYQSFFTKVLGITAVGFSQQHDIDEVILNLKAEGHSDKIALIYIETPANPTNALIDISKCVVNWQNLFPLLKRRCTLSWTIPT